MNFFIPTGFFGSNVNTSPITSLVRPDQGIVELLYRLDTGEFGPSVDRTLLQRIVPLAPSLIPTSIQNPLFLNKFPVQLTRTSLLEVKVIFCVTQYFLSFFDGSKQFNSSYYLQQRRLALADGSVSLSFFSNNELLGSTESTFLKNSSSATLRFNNFGLDLPFGKISGTLRCVFQSNLRFPFGPVDFPQFEIEYPFIVGEPNVSIETDTSNTFRSQTFAQLNVDEANSLISAAFVQADAFADLVTTPATDIGLKSHVNATGITNTNVRGGIGLATLVSASALAAGHVSIITALVADAPAQALSVAIASVGTTKFLSAAPVAITLTQTNLILSSRVSGMTLFVNLETRQFVVSPVLLSPVASIALTRRDLSAIDVQFVRGGRVVDLSFGSLGQIAVKDTFSEVPLAFNGAWQERGTGANTRYQFALNLNTDGINDLFSDDDGTALVTAKFELEWTEAGTLNTSLPATAIIHNDLIRGGEGVPTVTAAASFALLAPDGSLFTITIDDDGILTATKS